MHIFLVYDTKNDLEEVHLLEAAAQVRAEHFGGTYESRRVEPLPTYNSDELQQVIDDLDYARMFLPAQSRVSRSLQMASAILVTFPEECLASSKTGRVTEPWRPE